MEVQVKEITFLVIFCTLVHFSSSSAPSGLTRSIDFICDNATFKVCNASEDESYPNLIHVTAKGQNDTLHYLISTIGVPSLVVALTAPKATCTINQDHLFSGNFSKLGQDTIVFDPPPLYVYSVLFPTVYEYNDTDDTADMEKVPQDAAHWKRHHLSGLRWLPSKDISDKDNHLLYLNVTGSLTTDNKTDPFFFHENGSFSLKFLFKTADDRNDNLPHLEFNANNTQIAVALDNINTTYTTSRFGMEIIMMTDSESKSMNLNKTKSIDDEHTPGVFEMVDWTTSQESTLQTKGAYLQWKPICYKTVDRKLTAATKQFYYDLEPLDGDSLTPDARISLSFAYFGERMYDNKLTITAANMSFGLTKDKFYRDTNYTIWTFTVGYGTPPSDTISLMIIMVISVGLGLPVVLIIFGGTCVCIKKQRDKKEQENMTSSYSAIN